MSYKQSHRFLLQSCIIVGLAYFLWLFSSSADSQSSRARNNQEGNQSKVPIPVVAQQLDVPNGLSSVELKCDATALILPNTLDRIPCTIRNHTNRVITALVLGESVSIENNGKSSTESGYIAIDSFVHPDFHKKSETMGLKDAEPHFPFASVTYDGKITQLQVHIDYVESADKQILGPNRQGAEMIGGIRDGAAKYKDWLVKEFQTKGRSAHTLVSLLRDDQPLPVDLVMNSGSQEQGAAIYRNQLRKIYRTEGVEQLMKQWKSRITTTGNR
jgi:hypothetical protein